MSPPLDGVRAAGRKPPQGAGVCALSQYEVELRRRLTRSGSRMSLLSRSCWLHVPFGCSCSTQDYPAHGRETVLVSESVKHAVALLLCGRCAWPVTATGL